MNDRSRLASLWVPPLTAVVLLYRVLAELQITVLRPETLLVIGATVALGLLAGVVAAFGTSLMRVAVLSCVVVIWLDVTFALPERFRVLTPQSRAAAARDERRIADIGAIQAALNAYVAKAGGLPQPLDYGEAAGVPGFWEGWWDISSEDANGNGRSFLDFLVDGGFMAEVPVDPENQAPPGGNPAAGRQYVFFVAPRDYTYEGGQCEAHAGYSTYLLGVTDLEGESSRPPSKVSGSGCECLWRDKPNFFQQHFDYVVCGVSGP